MGALVGREAIDSMSCAGAVFVVGPFVSQVYLRDSRGRQDADVDRLLTQYISVATQR